LPAFKSIEVDAVGLPNILKKDMDQMTEKTEAEQEDTMKLPGKEKILVAKMKALQSLEESIAKENYLKKIKIIKGLKLSEGKEASSEKPENKTQQSLSGPGTGNADMNNEELFKYIDTLKNYIKKYWSVPTWFYAEGLNTIISLNLKDDGGIKEVKLYKSSGNDYFDNNAMKAIKEAAPFPPPPKTLLEIADNDGLLITFP
jgi:colicin import membrane protein